LFAVATLEFICARHHRRAVEIAFGAALGLLAGALINPTWPPPHALADAAIGAVVAIVIAIATSPSNPLATVNRAIDPLLAQVSGGVRAIASALRREDIAAAGAAVAALSGTEINLRRLDETLIQVRRSALLVHWRCGQDLVAATATASDIGHAVRNVRAMARQAWWGVLRGGEPVPAALPQMLETLADAVAILRTTVATGGHLRDTRRLLISAGQWVDVMRTQPLGISAAAVAKTAEAAVVNLLVATGLSAAAAEDSMRRPVLG
jgi:hypothetical protein